MINFAKEACFQIPSSRTEVRSGLTTVGNDMVKRFVDKRLIRTTRDEIEKLVAEWICGEAASG